MLRELYTILGMTISVLLLLFMKRQPDRQRKWAPGVLLGAAVFLIFAGAFVSTVLEAVGTPHHNWLFMLSGRITRSIATFAPSILFFGWRASPIFKEDPPIGTTLFRFSLVSAGLTALLIWVGPFDSMAGKNQLFLFNTLLVLLLGFRSLLKHKLSASLRLCMMITGAFYFFSIVIPIANPRGMEGFSTGDPSLIVLQEMCSLVGILGSFIFVARFRFADVFVKWSVRLVALGILSGAGAIGVTHLPSSIASTGSSSLLIGAVGSFALVSLAVALVPVTDRWVEHWVLHQADLKGQLELITSCMLAIHSEPDLLLEVDRQLIKCLDLTMARTLPVNELPKAVVDGLCSLGDVMESSNMLSRLSFDELPNVDLLVPVTVEGNLRYAIAICPGFGRRTLFSGEVQFLRTVARHLGLRIHNLEGEAAAREQALRESLLRNQLTDAELRALRAQVNPHFLFNSLNTIADFIVTNPANAERMTLRLASIFRHVLAQSDRQFMSLHEEFDFLRNYLQIEQERFGERLSVNMSLDPSIAHENVPTLLLQPLVENALKHGLAPKGGKGILQISALRHETSIELLVIDNGVGWQDEQIPLVISEASARQSGVGLANTAARLRTIYGDRASLNIESAPMQGCRVSITYPLKVPLYAMSDH
jgi:two-component system LytT family sensor kinase